MIAVGTDILKFERIEAVVERQGKRFIERILTPEERQEHAGAVQGEITRLSDRLATAASELEALAARLGADLGSDALLHEVRAWHQSTELALTAFADTVGELE